ncbi:hypothetical protein [Aquibacillus rhizosphaerae]|uniref:ABC transporter permease n=1 Tax=Aquibacillus rhizosphaerae TaxID=3051431 RepID=A0ABT7L1M2_9BACI|nr:hypothetical protein [Aquibacillus sp. LR5S19]MDL4839742.1 hypothetical protein [Aquibacillus sp. LR5S19]
MNPIKGLLKKDYRISRFLFLTWIGAMLVMLSFGIGMSAYTNQPAGTLTVIVLLGLSLAVFAPVMMLSMLVTEGKNQLWLYSPRSSYSLLLSKFAIILIYQLITQVLLTIYTAFSMYWFGKAVYEQLSIGLFLELAIFVNIGLVLLGIFLTCWITFYWTIYHALKRYPKIRNFRWLVIIFIFFGYNLLETLVLRIDAISTFIFKYNLDLLPLTSLNYEDESWNVLIDIVEIPIIPFFYFVILSLFLFYIASKLLAKKVEV